MSKGIGKDIRPAGIEKRLYDKWVEKGYFHCRSRQKQKPFTMVYAAPKYHGTASYGTCPR